MTKVPQIFRGDAYRHKNGDTYIVHGILYTPNTSPTTGSAIKELTTLRLRRKRDGLIVDRPASKIAEEIQKGSLTLSPHEQVRAMDCRTVIENGLVGIETVF